MPSYYDSNFGHYDVHDLEDIKWYHKVQEQSVWKRCSICKRRVKLMPDYDKCNSCCEKLERGGDIYE